MNVEELSVSDLKRILRSAGVDPSSCFEKADLVRAVKKVHNSAPGGQTRGSASSSAGPSTSSSTQSRNRSQSTPTPQRSRTEPQDDRTPDDELVKRINRTENDHYKVLEVEKDAGEDKIKKAYRKLALKLHPDKNKSRGAEDAFKKVSKAFEVLSDSNKRATYDRFGTDDPSGRGMGGGFGGGAEVSPEDIFNAFFGGGMPGGMHGGFHSGGVHFTNLNDLFGAGMRQQQRARTQQQQQQQQQRQRPAGGMSMMSMTNLIRFLPVLFTVLPLLIQLISAALANFHLIVLFFVMYRAFTR